MSISIILRLQLKTERINFIHKFQVWNQSVNVIMHFLSFKPDDRAQTQNAHKCRHTSYFLLYHCLDLWCHFHIATQYSIFFPFIHWYNAFNSII